MGAGFVCDRCGGPKRGTSRQYLNVEIGGCSRTLKWTWQTDLCDSCLAKTLREMADDVGMVLSGRSRKLDGTTVPKAS